MFINLTNITDTTRQELPRDTKVALGRLDAIFDAEKLLYTNMTLPTHFVLAVSNRIDEYGSADPSLGDSRSLSRTAKSSPRYVLQPSPLHLSPSMSLSDQKPRRRMMIRRRRRKRKRKRRRRRRRRRERRGGEQGRKLEKGAGLGLRV